MQALAFKPIIHRREYVYSAKLKRKVTVELVYPYKAFKKRKRQAVLLMNDGQDFEGLNMQKILQDFWATGGKPFLFVGVHCGAERLEEYGTRGLLDYAQRGKKAEAYQAFVLHELWPFLAEHFTLKKRNHVCGGFSLGGLSAFDMALHNATFFTKVGVFSGSFWWRSKALGPTYSDSRDRIAHSKASQMPLGKKMSFWFQCGTKDETSDRNGNGVIDSIDDTLDLIAILKGKGVKNVHYEEVQGGKHNLETWRKEMPKFLTWAFGMADAD